MSRSYRKRPFFGACKDQRQSEKRDKQLANRALRRAFRNAIHRDPELSVPPLIREVSNVDNFVSDGGKGWKGYRKYPVWDEFNQEFMKWYGPEAYAKMMRK